MVQGLAQGPLAILSVFWSVCTFVCLVSLLIVMDLSLTIEELKQLKVYCKNPRCAGAKGGDTKYIVPATNPSLACRLCDQPFDRTRIDTAIRGLGHEPGAVQGRAFKGGGKAATGGKDGKGKGGPKVWWDEGWGDAKGKAGGGKGLGGDGSVKGKGKGKINQLPDFAAQSRRADWRCRDWGRVQT